MANSKKAATPQKVDEVLVEIRKSRNVRHNAPIVFDGYLREDGVPRKMRFEEGSSEAKVYGLNTRPLRVDDNGVTLNLARPWDKLQYDIAVEMRDKGVFPFQPSSVLVDIIEPEIEDAHAEEKFNRKYQAMKIINEELQDPKDMREFAYYFVLAEGKDSTVKRNLIDLADDSPETILDAWGDAFRHLMVLTRKAIDKGLITLRGDTNIYVYGEVPLGMNHAEIVTALAKDTTLTTLLNSKV